MSFCGGLLWLMETPSKCRFDCFTDKTGGVSLSWTCGTFGRATLLNCGIMWIQTIRLSLTAAVFFCTLVSSTTVLRTRISSADVHYSELVPSTTGLLSMQYWRMLFPAQKEILIWHVLERPYWQIYHRYNRFSTVLSCNIGRRGVGSFRVLNWLKDLGHQQVNFEVVSKVVADQD